MNEIAEAIKEYTRLSLASNSDMTNNECRIFWEQCAIALVRASNGTMVPHTVATCADLLTIEWKQRFVVKTEEDK